MSDPANLIMGALGTFIFLCFIGVLAAIGLYAYDRMMRAYERRQIKKRKRVGLRSVK
jgi:hypothetical protein